MNTTIASVDKTNAPVLSVGGGDGSNAVSQINDLMVTMGELFGKMRDILRQYNQTQQLNAFKMQVTSLNTRMAGIEKEFDAKNAQAWGQIAGGVVQGIAGGVGAAMPGVSEAASGIGRGVSSGLDGILSLKLVNPQMRESQELQAKSEYQHGLAEQQLKRADETLSNAHQVSAQMREFMQTLVQAHDRITGSVRLS